MNSRAEAIIRNLSWAWLIVAGGLLITPRGPLCIVCGEIIADPRFIGYPAVTFLGVGSVILGILGLSTTIRNVISNPQAG